MGGLMGILDGRKKKEKYCFTSTRLTADSAVIGKEKKGGKNGTMVGARKRGKEGEGSSSSKQAPLHSDSVKKRGKEEECPDRAGDRKKRK